MPLTVSNQNLIRLNTAESNGFYGFILSLATGNTLHRNEACEHHAWDQVLSQSPDNVLSDNAFGTTHDV